VLSLRACTCPSALNRFAVIISLSQRQLMLSSHGCVATPG